MKKPVHWKRRFRFNWEHKDGRFSMRIVIGFFLLYVARQWRDYRSLFQFESTFEIGWIPLRVEEGQRFPCWIVFRRVEPTPVNWRVTDL